MLYNANKAGDLWIDFYLAALDGKRVARMQHRYSDGGTGLQHKLDFGVHFRFVIPSIQAFKGSEAVEGGEKDYCDAISQVIGQYFLPTDEYHRAKRTEAETVQSMKSVNIQPGMTEEELLKALGEPQKRIQFGSKIILKYEDISVELQEGRSGKGELRRRRPALWPGCHASTVAASKRLIHLEDSLQVRCATFLPHQVPG